MTTWAGSSELTDVDDNLIVQYTYDAAGNLIQQDNGNGTFTVYTYDGDGDVLSITNYAPSTGGDKYVPANSTVNSFDDYTYDAFGNVLTDTNQDGQWVYTYDADSQLTQAIFTSQQHRPGRLDGPEPAIRLRRGRQPHFRDGQRRDHDVRLQQRQRVHELHHERRHHDVSVRQRRQPDQPDRRRQHDHL